MPHHRSHPAPRAAVAVGGLLNALGQKLAERWLTLLVLPGALFLAAAAAAHTLGQAHALDRRLLVSRITEWTDKPAVSTVGGQVVLLGAVLAAAAVAGLAAQGAGALLQRAVLAAEWRSWPGPLRRAAHALVTRRRARWTAAATRYHQQLNDEAQQLARTGRRADPSIRRGLHRAMHRVAAEEPDRPTWSGDCLNAAAVRLERDRHLELPLVWPHLWLVLSETARAEITAAEQALTRATTLGGWALLYAPLTAWWWPAAPLAVTLALVARHRVRTATDTYAQLLVAAVLLHAGDLAEQLRIEHSGPLDTALGEALTDHLRTSTPRT